MSNANRTYHIIENLQNYTNITRGSHPPSLLTVESADNKSLQDSRQLF